MDEFLIYGVFILFYIIYSVLTAGKKKKRVPPQAGPPLPGPAPGPVEATAAEPTLDDALREIRIALGMEPPPTPSPPRTASPPVRSHGPELAETAPQKSWSSEFRPIPSHYADETFEELPTRDGDRFGQRRKPSKKSSVTPQKASTPQPAPQSQAPTGVRPSRIMQQLNDPNAAREAFILSEIFGLPHALRRR